MSQVVSERGGLGGVDVKGVDSACSGAGERSFALEPLCESTRELGHLQRMREPTVEHQTGFRRRHLCHVRESLECGRVEDSIAVALGLGPGTQRFPRVASVQKFRTLVLVGTQRSVSRLSSPLGGAIWSSLPRCEGVAYSDQMRYPDNEPLIDSKVPGVDEVPEGDRDNRVREVTLGRGDHLPRPPLPTRVLFELRKDGGPCLLNLLGDICQGGRRTSCPAPSRSPSLRFYRP